MLNDFTEGRHCFTIINYRPVAVRLVERDNHLGGNTPSYTVQRLNADGHSPRNPYTGIVYGIRRDDLYETEAAAREQAEARKAAYIERTCASIKSVRELIDFPLTHDILEKNTDSLYPEKELNRIAYRRRAEELLRI